MVPPHITSEAVPPSQFLVKQAARNLILASASSGVTMPVNTNDEARRIATSSSQGKRRPTSSIWESPSGCIVLTSAQSVHAPSQTTSHLCRGQRFDLLSSVPLVSFATTPPRVSIACRCAVKTDDGETCSWKVLHQHLHVSPSSVPRCSQRLYEKSPCHSVSCLFSHTTSSRKSSRTSVSKVKEICGSASRQRLLCAAQSSLDRKEEMTVQLGALSDRSSP